MLIRIKLKKSQQIRLDITALIFRAVTNRLNFEGCWVLREIKKSGCFFEQPFFFEHIYLCFLPFKIITTSMTSDYTVSYHIYIYQHVMNTQSRSSLRIVSFLDTPGRDSELAHQSHQASDIGANATYWMPACAIALSQF